jgi:hypothetical protein
VGTPFAAVDDAWHPDAVSGKLFRSEFSLWLAGAAVLCRWTSVTVLPQDIGDTTWCHGGDTSPRKNGR